MGAEYRPHAATMTQLKTATSKIFDLQFTRHEADDELPLLTIDCDETFSTPPATPLLTEDKSIELVPFRSAAVSDAMTRSVWPAMQLACRYEATSGNRICGHPVPITTE